VSLEENFKRQADARGALAKTRQRLSFAMTAFSLVLVLLFGRLVEVSVLREPSGAKAARVESDTSYYRADIVDRKGEILATDLQGASLYADARVVWDPAEAARDLQKVLPGLNVETVTRKLSTRQAFVWIKRNISPGQQEAVRQLGLPGLSFKQEPRRVYPNGRTASHVLGYVSVDNHGLAGIERGVEDLVIERRNKGGVVELSLDLRVQHVLEDELSAAIAGFRAKAAAGVVMDVNNGEVLALSSLPDFDPNDPGSAAKNALFNRATLGVFEMGSTFKIFTAASALDSGKITMASQYDTSAPLSVGQYTIADFHPENRMLSVPEVLMYSSNIGAARIATEAGPEVQRSYFTRLGLLGPVPFEIKELGAPLLPKRWGELEVMTTAYGHGIAVSPLHMAAAASAIVNGGKYIRPTILKREEGGVIAHTRVISEQTSSRMREMLRMVVTQGTGGKADVPGYPVGGKTGTAEKTVGKGYDEKSLVTSFVGVFPAKAPLYLVLVVLDEPQPSEATHGFASAGWTAAPTAGKVIARIAPMLNVPVAPIEPSKGAPTTLASYEELR
jgi:cell division protein FtsI (penicillin-binding protein 3)